MYSNILKKILIRIWYFIIQNVSLKLLGKVKRTRKFKMSDFLMSLIF